MDMIAVSLVLRTRHHGFTALGSLGRRRCHRGWRLAVGRQVKQSRAAQGFGGGEAYAIHLLCEQE